MKPRVPADPAHGRDRLPAPHPIRFGARRQAGATEPGMVQGRQVFRQEGTGTAGFAGHFPASREDPLRERPNR
jgi:hypothetical protein